MIVVNAEKVVRNDSNKQKKSEVSQSVLYSTQQLVRTIVQEAYYAVQNGNTAFFETHDIDKDLISEINKLQPFELDQLAMNYARYTLSNQESSGIILNINEALTGIGQRSEENDLADRFLIAGASNSNMSQFFCMRSTECSQRRKRLGIKTGRGRKAQPKGDREIEKICQIYDENMNCPVNMKCPRRVLLKVHEDTGHYIDFIYSSIQKYHDLAWTEEKQ